MKIDLEELENFDKSEAPLGTTIFGFLLRDQSQLNQLRKKLPNIIAELKAAREVIASIRNDELRQPWFVLEALQKYDEVTGTEGK